MRKLLVFVALFAMVGVSYAQESVERSVDVYLDAYSGDIVNDNISEGNCFEFGVAYTQNFSGASWLSMSFYAFAIGNQMTSYDENDKWNGNSGYWLDVMPAAGLSLDFGGFGYLSADTRSFVTVGGGYGHDFEEAGEVGYGVDLEFFAVPVDEVYLDLFQVYAGYSTSFADSWGFETVLNFMFFDDSSAAAFSESFALSWDNTISYEIDGIELWGTVSYQIDNMANDEDLLHQVYLFAGVGYSFDLH